LKKGVSTTEQSAANHGSTKGRSLRGDVKPEKREWPAEKGHCHKLLGIRGIGGRSY